jgi:hypothetical protein
MVTNIFLVFSFSDHKSQSLRRIHNKMGKGHRRGKRGRGAPGGDDYHQKKKAKNVEGGEQQEGAEGTTNTNPQHKGGWVSNKDKENALFVEFYKVCKSSHHHLFHLSLKTLIAHNLFFHVLLKECGCDSRGRMGDFLRIFEKITTNYLPHHKFHSICRIHSTFDQDRVQPKPSRHQDR